MKLAGATSCYFYLSVFVVVLLIQGAPFLAGYRLTADDVAFHQYVMQGWSASWEFVKTASVGQGRIVHFLDLPFALLGSYYADNFLFRVFYTSLYFGNFILVGLYASLLLLNRYALRFSLLLALVLTSFHPLDYFHLAPTSYPLHVSLPIFLILVSRMGLWGSRMDDQLQTSAQEVAWLSFCFSGMMLSEYGFLIGVSCMFAEASARTFRTAKTKNSFWGAILYWLRHRYTLKDFFIAALFLLLYFGFRSIYPSNYAGNQLAADFHIAPFLKTLFGHIYGGTSLASFARYHSLIADSLSNISVVDGLFTLVVFVGTFLVANFCIQGIWHKDEFSLPTSGFLVTALIAFLCALIVTAPVAATGMKQSWCGNIHACVFLDSRISYLAVGVFFSALLVSVIKLLTRARVNSAITIAASLLLSTAASVSYVNNKGVEMDMQEFAGAWERGKLLACGKDLIPRAVKISSIVDPLQRVSYHPGFDMDFYWSKYLEDQRLKRNCQAMSRPIADLYPEVVLGRKMLARNTGVATSFLGPGWSTPESWGVWSVGDAAEIYLPDVKGMEEIVIEVAAFVRPFHPKQDVAIKLNGISLSGISIDHSNPELIQIAITDEIKRSIPRGGLIALEFKFPNAVSPLDLHVSSDPRKLSIGLISAVVR
jgi:hypothetical protein